MNTEVSRKTDIKLPFGLSIKFIVISLLALIMLAISLSSYFIYRLLNYDRVYKGLYVNGINVSGYSRTALKDFLREKYSNKLKDKVLEIQFGNSVEKADFLDIGVTYNIKATEKEVYETGRTGNIVYRLYDIYLTSRNDKKLYIKSHYNVAQAGIFVNSFYEKVYKKVDEPGLKIYDYSSQVWLRSGHNGESFDKSKVLAWIAASVKKCKGGRLVIPKIITPRGKIDIDAIYHQIMRKPEDARAVAENNKCSVIPEVEGRSIDRTVLENIVAQLEKTEDAEKLLPVVYLTPAIKTADVYRNLLRDILYTASTKFSTWTQNDSNRGNNIRLAVSKIDGTIVSPGQIFSFNETVGRRTSEGGYKIAHTYSGGKVIDSIGGGVCQVSTTLYNTVLFSDLEVIERSNHSFVVKYVPFGRDAAVSYGQVDFKFRNNTKWPVRINGSVSSGNIIQFTLTGTNENPGKTIEILHKTLKTINYKVKYIDDPSLEKGKTLVKQKGSRGYVVDTYKIVKQDGVIISNIKIHTSYYKALDTEIRRGTGKLPNAVTPTQEAKGVDDAGNPPAAE